MAYVTRSEQHELIQAILDHVENGTEISVPPGFHIPRISKNRLVANDWLKNWHKFETFLKTGVPQFTIYTKGNGKLPFHSFSTLPGEQFCPGAGDCLEFCYSFKAWRYPAAFFRQVQNTILLKSPSGRAYLEYAFSKIPDHDFRLYVDGDFDSLETMKFWFDLLTTRPGIRAYGYSKSWQIFLAYNRLYTFPENYTLNSSSGSKFANSKAIHEKLQALPVYRGNYIAIPSDSKMPNVIENKSEWVEWAKELRQRAKLFGIQNAWICPGKCGNCTPRGHACGNKKFKNVDIVIGIH